MTRKRRTPPRTDHGTHVQQMHVGTCTACGKQCYASRKTAKRQARILGDPGLRAYCCGTFWHVGHLPPAVRAGRMTVADIYGGAS